MYIVLVQRSRTLTCVETYNTSFTTLCMYHVFKTTNASGTFSSISSLSVSIHNILLNLPLFQMSGSMTFFSLSDIFSFLYISHCKYAFLYLYCFLFFLSFLSQPLYFSFIFFLSFFLVCCVFPFPGRGTLFPLIRF